MERRTINIKKMVLTVDVIGKKPDGSPDYEVGIWIAKDEVEDAIGVDLYDLKRVLLSEKEGVLGLVFEYLDRNSQKKDILVTRKINPIQVRQLKQANWAVVILALNDGTLVKGITAQIIPK